MRSRLIFTLAVVLLGGCATTTHTALVPPGSAQGECTAWYQRLDDIIDREGVRDREAHRLPGLPFLRSNRLLASLGDQAIGNTPSFLAWLEALRDLDRRARDIEMQNLSPAARASLGTAGAADAVSRREACARALMAEAIAGTPPRSQIATASRVPDDYSMWHRMAGLYPLTSRPFFAGIREWQAATLASFAAEESRPFDARVHRRYAPPGDALYPDQVAAILRRAPRDALGLLHYSASDREALLAAFAPDFEVETRNDDDRFGALQWRADDRLQVAVDQPTVYHRLDFTRFDGRLLTQLVYTLWFPRRPADGPFDLVAGKLDGVMVRVTLDEAGRPLLVDSAHACGCYHLFFPSRQMIERPAPTLDEEWAFVPSPLPPTSNGRLMIRLAPGSHYVNRIGAVNDAGGTRYRLRGEDLLRALPAMNGRTRSIYGPDAFIAGTERAERWLFWPMGVANAGAMRQWGHHATAFVGRRHFDDARLIEERFRMRSEDESPSTRAIPPR